jgi:hypothetical protein
VVAYMSLIHQDPDLAVEIFVLEPGDESLVGLHEHDLEHGLPTEEPTS